MVTLVATRGAPLVSCWGQGNQAIAGGVQLNTSDLGVIHHIPVGSWDDFVGIEGNNLGRKKNGF